MAAGAIAGTLNGLIITRLKILPFIATLAVMLAASGTALLLANNQSVSVSYDSGFHRARAGQSARAVPPGLDRRRRCGLDRRPAEIPVRLSDPGLDRAGSLCDRLGGAQLHGLRPARAGGRRRRGSLAPDGPADRPHRIPGLPDLGHAWPGRSGVILAAQFGAGQPIEGIGWELFAIASVVVGGTLLTGGKGSVMATLAGVMLLGLIFTILNFENGMGWISLSAYWQSVVRGAFLFVVVILQSRLTKTSPA